MSDFQKKVVADLAQVRRETDEAMARARAAGEDPDEAGIRAGLEHALSSMPGVLGVLRGHGFVVDGGSYLLGSQLAVLAIQGVDPLDALHHAVMGRLLREYVGRAAAL